MHVIISNIDDVISNNNYYYKSRAKSLIVLLCHLEMYTHSLKQQQC